MQDNQSVGGETKEQLEHQYAQLAVQLGDLAFKMKVLSKEISNYEKLGDDIISKMKDLTKKSFALQVKKAATDAPVCGAV